MINESGLPPQFNEKSQIQSLDRTPAGAATEGRLGTTTHDYRQAAPRLVQPRVPGTP
jgi:hypothetical protein